MSRNGKTNQKPIEGQPSGHQSSAGKPGTGKASTGEPSTGRPGERGTGHDRLARRLTQLLAGLALYGISMALMIESTLGLDPWDVFHQGIAQTTGLRFGWVVIGVGALVLLLWIPLRQRPGIGTVANVVVIGLVVDGALAALPTAGPLWLRIAFLAGGILLNGVATGLYLGARLGPGPRDGLMTGYVAGHPRRSVRSVRTTIEVVVLLGGWLLGGTVGVGTVAYALLIGPLAQLFLPRLTVRARPATNRPAPAADQPHPTADRPHQGAHRSHPNAHQPGTVTARPAPATC